MKIRNLVFTIIMTASGILSGSSLFAQSVAKLHMAATVAGFEDSTQVSLFSPNNPAVKAAASVVANGSFVLETSLPQPDMYVLSLTRPGNAGEPKYYQLFLDNEVVELSIAADRNDVQVGLGPTPLAFSDLIQNFGPYFDGLSSTSKLRQQAGSNGFYSDSLAKAWDMHLQNIATQLPGFLQRNPSTSVAAFLLSTVWPLYNDVGQMDNWLSILQPAARQNVFAKNLEQQLAVERQFGYGQVAPDFIQNDPNDKPVSLKAFRGKYVLVDFWASWCGPCRQENPNVVEAFKKFQSKNFTVLGVSLDRDKSKWLKAIEDDKLTWPHVSDLKFWQNEVAQLYKVTSIPQNYLLDPEGRIIGKNLRGPALDDFLAQTLAGK